MTTTSRRPRTADTGQGLHELPILDSATNVIADGGLLEDAEHLSDALSELIRVIQFRDRDRACCYDISVSQCYALKSIVDAGPLTINELAAHLYLDKSTASRVANGLVDKGLVVRERDAEDGRIVRLVATVEGASVSSTIASDLTREYAQMLSDFDPEVRAAITRLVARLGQSFTARVEASGGTCCVVG